MTRILVMSDTHGNQQLLRLPFAAGTHYSHIFHLGDNYEDLDENPDLTEGRELHRVPGLYHPGYLSGSLPRYQKVEVDGWRFLLVHSPEDTQRTPHDDVQFVLYGHTHKPGIMQQNGQAWCNPGHLKRAFDRGHAPSWLVIELHDDEAHLTLHDRNGNATLRTTVTR